MAVGFARIGEVVHQSQRSGLSQGSLWSQWEAGQNPLGTREMGCDPGRLTLDKERLLGQEVAQNHSQETRTGLSKKVSVCGFACVRSPWSFVSAMQEKLLVLESYSLFPSLTLFLFLKGIKSLFALIMGASRDISLRPGGVGGGRGRQREALTASAWAPSLLEVMSLLASAPQGGWGWFKSLPVAHGGFQ